MRISDWSSDVCSSDLRFLMIRNTPTASCWCLRFYSLKDEYDESCHGGKGAGQGVCVASAARRGPECIARPGLYADARRVPGFAWPFGRGQEIGRATCRERVCRYV